MNMKSVYSSNGFYNLLNSSVSAAQSGKMNASQQQGVHKTIGDYKSLLDASMADGSMSASETAKAQAEYKKIAAMLSHFNH